jgi:hypothetical protein
MKRHAYAGITKNRGYPSTTKARSPPNVERAKFRRDLAAAHFEWESPQDQDEQKKWAAAHNLLNAEDALLGMIDCLTTFLGYWRAFQPHRSLPDYPRKDQQDRVNAVQAIIQDAVQNCDWRTEQLLLARLWTAVIDEESEHCSLREWLQRDQDLDSWYSDFRKIFEGCPDVSLETLLGADSWAASDEKRRVSQSLRRRSGKNGAQTSLTYQIYRKYSLAGGRWIDLANLFSGFHRKWMSVTRTRRRILPRQLPLLAFPPHHQHRHLCKPSTLTYLRLQRWHQVYTRCQLSMERRPHLPDLA